MIVFVDYEHADHYRGDSAQRVQAARTWITYRLEDLSGLHCMLARYDRVTSDLLFRLGAKAIFISGNATAPSRYSEAATAELAAIVRESGLPVFGFCGGFQFLSHALGAAVVPIDVGPNPVESDQLKRFPGDRFGEVGYHSVELLGDHPVVAGLGDRPVFRHAHGLHVPNPPPGFDVLASTEITPVQLAVHDQQQIVGTQFHPEYWTDEHPAGRLLISNFMRWVGLTTAG